MTSHSPEDVKVLILSCLQGSMSSLGLAPGELSDDFDMRAEGLVDSLGFVGLIIELEELLGFDIDLADLDPEHLTIVGPLSRHIAGTDTVARLGMRLAGE